MSKKKFRAWYVIFAVLSWISLLTPISIWIGINLDKYIVNKNGLTVSTGGILAVLFVVLLLKYGIKKFGKVFWMTMLLVIVYCLNTIIVDAFPLTFFTWLGAVLYSVFEIPMKYFKNKMTVYVDEEIRTVARQSAVVEEPKRKSGRC